MIFNFHDFCEIANVSDTKLKKIDTVVLFMWFHHKIADQPEISIKEINDYFLEADLPIYNQTHLKKALTVSTKITKGSKKETYKLNRKAVSELDVNLKSLLTAEVTVIERANLSATPYLTSEDIENAKEMSQLYLIVHCLENSVRSFLIDAFSKKFGDDWWSHVKNKGTDEKYTDRKQKERKNKWLSPRGGASPLFYLDWGDLVHFFKKYEADFKDYFDFNFIQHRLDDLEQIRNIIAHNGVLPSKDDFERIIVYFNDWCRQLKL